MVRDWFEAQPAVLQALLAGLFTWGVTAAGASLVLFVRTVHRRLLDSMLGFSGGVMLAASYWSLLAPAIEISRHGSLPVWLPPVLGFLAGGGAMWVLDKSLPHLHLGLESDKAEGPQTTWHRAALLVTAIAIHNVPEGLAVGVSFGGFLEGVRTPGIEAALVLSLGIGLQNFPEGMAVALPLRGEGFSRLRCFWYGQLSALVEPLAAVIGAAVVGFMAPGLPYALSFAAGAMVYVVVEELIPESHQEGNVDLATLSLLAGFALMMALDAAFA